MEHLWFTWFTCVLGSRYVLNDSLYCMYKCKNKNNNNNPVYYLQVFGIGIGSGVDKAELGRIATDASHVFTVTNFDALSTLQAELKKTACESTNQYFCFCCA